MHEVIRECDLGIFASIGPFGDELITGNMDAAIERLESLTGLEAAQLILATYRRSDSVITDADIDRLAEAIGVFEDDE